MEGFLVRGGERIWGEMRVDAAKNAVLPILAASILPDGQTLLKNCPEISDVKSMCGILETLGCKTKWTDEGLLIDARTLSSGEMPEHLSKKIRSSIFLLGPILGKLRKATMVYPGGCEIGLRPIDLHLSGLRKMGVVIREEGGVLHCDGSNMHAADVHLDYPSVGATENVMMSAVLLEGVTTITNAAREPEIEDLQHYINAMGGCVKGAGTHTIVVKGVKALHGGAYEPMPDRIVAGTYLCAAAMTGGAVTLTNARTRDLKAVLEKLAEMGCALREEENLITLAAPCRLKAFHQVQTQPYPGFPTDMQSQMLALSTVAKGSSVVVENVFENRFALVNDMICMGANIRVSGRAAFVQGVDRLHGAQVQSRDLRAGAAMVLAALRAEGETLVRDVHFIDRGYEKMEERLRALGADIRRITVNDA